MGGSCSTPGWTGNADKIVVGKPDGKRSLGTPSLRRKDNIKIDLRQIGYDDLHFL
jgi:hypothetical protein